MRELVDADSASLPTASTGGDAPQQSEIVFRGNRAHRPHGKRGARGEESRNGQRVSIMENLRQVGRAAPNALKERKQEPG